MSIDPKQSRGYRNKNPGNIDFNERNKWQGQVGIEPPPVGGRARFAVFQSHEYGIRALATLLITYQDRHNLRTVWGIISRWAPGGENNTTAYVTAVARKMNVSPDQELDLHSYAHLRPMVEAIITHELGGQPYPPSVLDDGLRMAGVPRPVTTVVQAVSTQTGAGAVTVAGAAAAATAAAPAIQALGGLSPWVGGLIVILAAVGAAIWVLRGRRDA